MIMMIMIMITVYLSQVDGSSGESIVDAVEKMTDEMKG